MKVFISWSGERSKALATALKGWIPLIIQYAQPWVSEKDISAGERWGQAISEQLESSNFGILCVTPENINSEWILFEAGALSKSMLDARVIPLLFELELSDLRGPLSQFQALKIDQQGLTDVIKAINSVSETKTPEDTINQLVPALWAQLQEKISSIPGKPRVGKHSRPQGEVLEELVSQVRGLGSRLIELDSDFVDRDVRYSRRSYREFDHRLIYHFMQETAESRSNEYSLLILAGFVRELAPWLAEILVESHRELKIAGLREAQIISHRIIRIIKIAQMGLGERMMVRTKAGQTFMMELPMLVEQAISLQIRFRRDSGESREEGNVDNVMRDGIRKME